MKQVYSEIKAKCGVLPADGGSFRDPRLKVCGRVRSSSVLARAIDARARCADSAAVTDIDEVAKNSKGGCYSRSAA